MNTPVLDPSTLERLRALQQSVGPSASVIAELRAIFERDSRSYLDGLDAALRGADEDETQRLLHTLKGAALSVGAARVAERCLSMEKAEVPPVQGALLELREQVQDALLALLAAQHEVIPPPAAR